MLFFSLEIAKNGFFVLYFLKNVLYFVSYLSGWNIYFKFFIYNTKIGEL